MSACKAFERRCQVAGDLTDYGLPEEAQMVIKQLNAAVGIPIIAVLGNHEYQIMAAVEDSEQGNAGAQALPKAGAT
jgi:3',5'-cyclic AMP phosphodiesterase CpdA